MMFEYMKTNIKDVTAVDTKHGDACFIAIRE